MKDICIVCVRKIVGLQGMIYILCIYAFPMNISKYIWHKISHHLQGAFFNNDDDGENKDDNIKTRRRKKINSMKCACIG